MDELLSRVLAIISNLEAPDRAGDASGQSRDSSFLLDTNSIFRFPNLYDSAYLMDDPIVLSWTDEEHIFFLYWEKVLGGKCPLSCPHNSDSCFPICHNVTIALLAFSVGGMLGYMGGNHHMFDLLLWIQATHGAAVRSITSISAQTRHL